MDSKIYMCAVVYCEQVFELVEHWEIFLVCLILEKGSEI